MFAASTHDYMLFFTNLGRVYWLKVFLVPQMSRTAAGRALVNVLELQEGERITGVIPVREFDQDSYLLMATAGGVVKKTPLDACLAGSCHVTACRQPKYARLRGADRRQTLRAPHSTPGSVTCQALRLARRRLPPAWAVKPRRTARS